MSERKRNNSAQSAYIIVNDIKQCELCGSRRGLEVHHIIPFSLGGDDSAENLIALCQSCHAKLTPKSLLIKLGQRTKRPFLLFGVNKIMQEFYETVDDGGVWSGSEVIAEVNKTFERLYGVICIAMEGERNE